MLLEASGNAAFCKPPAGLYLVATPIGNLGDITLRGLDTLARADIVACEDTRKSGLLLRAFGIQRPMISYHDHNADVRRPELLKRIGKGEAVVLITDAGMPAIADPGFKLVRDCQEAGFPLTVIPGASAAVSALAISGLPTDQFLFGGFLSPKSAARRKELSPYKGLEATLVFYESPARLAASLADLAAVLGEKREAAVARELTKLFEEVKRGTLGDLAAYYKDHEAKGEIVILVGKANEPSSFLDLDSLLAERLKCLSVRDAAAEVAEMAGMSKKDVYLRALAIQAKR